MMMALLRRDRKIKSKAGGGRVTDKVKMAIKE